MKEQKLAADCRKVQRAVAELLKNMSMQDALRVLAFARRISQK